MIAVSCDEVHRSDIERDDETPRRQMLAEATQIRSSLALENDNGGDARKRGGKSVYGLRRAGLLLRTATNTDRSTAPPAAGSPRSCAGIPGSAHEPKVAFAKQAAMIKKAATLGSRTNANAIRMTVDAAGGSGTKRGALEGDPTPQHNLATIGRLGGAKIF
jgi:hypothetical protein